jgi:hypothetical protein
MISIDRNQFKYGFNHLDLGKGTQQERRPVSIHPHGTCQGARRPKTVHADSSAAQTVKYWNPTGVPASCLLRTKLKH